MWSFVICVCILILGYVLYGAFVEKVFGADSKKVTPAVEKNDGFDFVPMPAWKVFLIQFINIAGTGPIFGAIMGAMFGPASFIWIVVGCIFAGAVHDYLSGMISLRNGGISTPDVVGKYLGKGTRGVMLVFCVLLLILVGAVFVFTPAQILGDVFTFGQETHTALLIWAAVIFIYYLIDTLLPIDKIIGKVFPVFGGLLILTAIALAVVLVIHWPAFPEIWGEGGLSVPVKGQPLFPCLFVTIACGAISGFHATQTPLMARCLTNEKLGRPIFYGAMITEGVIALIWAAISSFLFFGNGTTILGPEFMFLQVGAPGLVVEKISLKWLGAVGGIFAIIGIVGAPVTSGDSALRSARMIIADAFHIKQENKLQRLYLAIPIFTVVAIMVVFNIKNPDGFNVLWRYFGWANQTLACFILWTATAYLLKEKGGFYYIITLIPACFMTAVCVTYLGINKIGFNLPESTIPYLGLGTVLVSVIVFTILKNRKAKKSE